MVKIRRLGSDPKKGTSTRKDSCVNNSVYQICTDRVLQRSTIRKISGIHAEERGTLGCIPGCISKLKQKKPFIQNYKISRKVDKKALVPDSSLNTAVPRGATVYIHESPHTKLQANKELSRNVPEKSHHGIHTERGSEYHHVKTTEESESSGVSTDRSDTMYDRKLSNEDLMQNMLVNKDNRSGIGGEQCLTDSFQNSRSLSQNQNNSLTYIRQPVMDDEWNKLVCKWQAEDKNNQMEKHRQQCLRRRSRNNSHGRSGGCLSCYKFPASDASRDYGEYPRKTRGEILGQWKCHEPNVVYLCDKCNMMDGHRQHPTTTVYLCEMAKQADASPKRNKSSRYTIGTKRDIAPPGNHTTKFNIRVPDLPPEECYEDLVRETGQDSTWCCQQPSKSYTSYPRARDNGIWSTSLTGLFRFLLMVFVGLLRWIIMFTVFFLILLGLLIFINFNTCGHYCVLALIVLFLYILILAPDKLLIYYYLL